MSSALAVELTIAIRISTSQQHAASIAAELADAVESVVGTTVQARGERVITLDTPRDSAAHPQIRIDVGSRRVRVRDAVVTLTKLEFDLLLYLCTHPGRVLDRSTLMAEVWGLPEAGAGRTVDVHIRKLRGKLGAETLPITTVRGVGYRFDGDDRVRVVHGLPVRSGSVPHP